MSEPHVERDHRPGHPAPDLIASQRRPPECVSPEGRPTGPSAQRLTRPAAPLPTGLCRMPHTINSPISPKT
jgi:hypothetical protein